MQRGFYLPLNLTENRCGFRFTMNLYHYALHVINFKARLHMSSRRQKLTYFYDIFYLVQCLYPYEITLLVSTIEVIIRQ